MKEEQQRIRIAEACGWTAEQDSNGYWRAANKKHGNAVELWLSERSVWSVGIPDYLNDLNAMHEAEELCGEVFSIKSCEYDDWLSCVIGHDQTWRATAAQRAEAFLKTLGLWEEES